MQPFVTDTPIFRTRPLPLRAGGDCLSGPERLAQTHRCGPDKRVPPREARDATFCHRHTDFDHDTTTASRRRGLPLRFAAVALPGQTFVFPMERGRSRAGFVRTGAACANTPMRTRQAGPSSRGEGCNLLSPTHRFSERDLYRFAQEGTACQDRSGLRKHTDADPTSGSLLARRGMQPFVTDTPIFRTRPLPLRAGGHCLSASLRRLHSGRRSANSGR